MLNDFRIAIVGVEGYAIFSARNKHSWFCVLGCKPLNADLNIY